MSDKLGFKRKNVLILEERMKCPNAGWDGRIGLHSMAEGDT